MDIKKFNDSVSELIKNSNNTFGFVPPEQSKQLYNMMDDVAKKMKDCIDECLKICHEQNLIGVDNVVFGEYLFDMSKSMWTNIMSQPIKEVLSNEESLDSLIELLSIEDMKLMLAQHEATTENKKLIKVLPKYDSLSESIIKDAFKTMQLQKQLGEKK